MRELFLSRLIELLEKDSVKWEVFSKQKYDQIINDVKKVKNKVFRDPADSILLQKYDVISENGIEKLVKPSIFNHHKCYVYEEQLYDIIYSVHIETNHGDLSKLMKSLQMKYIDIPYEIIQLWLSLCQVCKSKKNSMHELEAIKSESGQKIRVTQQDNWLSNYSKTPQEGIVEKQITVINLSDDDDDEAPINCAVSLDPIADKNIDDSGKKSGEEISVVATVNNKNISDVIPSIPSSSFSIPNLPSTPSHEAPIPNVPSDFIEKEHTTPAQLPVNSSQIVQDVEDDDDDDIEIEQPTEVSLRWNLYDSNMKSVLSNFLYEEQFVDVTLTCENESIQCHKVILSASSPYFEKLFRQNPSRHPIVLMNDLYFWEVQALVEFIYKGEIKVPRSKLESLLDAAEALQIKGLAEPVDKMPTKNFQLRKKLFKKRMSNIKSYNHEKKCLTVRNVRNYNKTKLIKTSVEKSETGTQTSSDMGNINDSNFVTNFPTSFQHQINDPNPNAYTVFTQTYPNFSKTGSQNIINNPSGVISQVPHPLIPCPETSSVPVLMPQLAFPPVSLSENPQSLSNRNYQNHSITVCCSSFTQTSPQREDGDDNDTSPSENNISKKQKMATRNKRTNFDLLLDDNDLFTIDGVCLKNKSNSKAIKKCQRRSKRKHNSIDEKINSLLSRGDTNVIFTRKKTADMESIANRTRKKQSEVVRKRRLKIFD